MKQIEGNNPMCWSCYYYIEAEGKKEWFDGYCINDYNLTHGINGKLRTKKIARIPERWNDHCRQWEDAETRCTYHDYITGKYREQKKADDPSHPFADDVLMEVGQ